MGNNPLIQKENLTTLSVFFENGNFDTVAPSVEVEKASLLR